MRIRLSPEGGLYVRDDRDMRWLVWSPNGEYFESDFGDELTDEQVFEWPQVEITNAKPPALPPPSITDSRPT